MAEATCTIAQDSLLATGKAREDYRKAGLLPTDQDLELATRALTWAREHFGSIPEETRSDFEQNMYVATKSEVLTRRALGFAAYAVQAYLRHLGEEAAKRAAAEQGIASRHLGTVGERIRFRATITDIKRLEGAFGTTFLHKMTTAEGHCLVWFASGGVATPTDDGVYRPTQVGETWEFVGTVKDHGEFRGVLQTTMSRCKILSADDLAKEEKKAARKPRAKAA